MGALSGSPGAAVCASLLGFRGTSKGLPGPCATAGGRPGRASSSVGQSARLISVRPEVQVLPGPPPGAAGGDVMWCRPVVVVCGAADGGVAQRESACFASRGSSVRSRSPPQSARLPRGARAMPVMPARLVPATETREANGLVRRRRRLRGGRPRRGCSAAAGAVASARVFDSVGRGEAVPPGQVSLRRRVPGEDAALSRGAWRRHARSGPVCGLMGSCVPRGACARVWRGGCGVRGSLVIKR